MTQVSFLYDGDRLCGFDAKGHTGYSQSGTDIVCAAVSSALYMAANTVVEVIGAECDELDVSDGYMSLIVCDKDVFVCSDTFEGLELHIQQLSEQYPDEIRLIRRKR